MRSQSQLRNDKYIMIGKIYLLALRKCEQNSKIQIGSAVSEVLQLVLFGHFSISALIEMLITAKIKGFFQKINSSKVYPGDSWESPNACLNQSKSCLM